MYLTTVNLSNANFNDQAIINLMEKNKFQMPNILIEFDISIYCIIQEITQ